MFKETDNQDVWKWVGIATGIALGVAGVVYLLRQTDAPHRLERLLARCENRIHGLEDTLTGLENSLNIGPA
jgi:hypothetical protein